jgi:hypothetical protein
MSWFRKKLKGYRTILVNTLLTVMPILEMTELLSVLPDGWQNWYAIAMAVINLWLRSITTTPMGKKL